MLHRMTEQEIGIRRINDVRMISVYEFTDAVQKPGEGERTSGNPAGCTAVTVLFEDSKQITLTELDPCFETLCGRILEIYKDPANRSKILTDPATKALLEAGVSVTEEPLIEGFNADNASVIATLPFDATLGRRFVPLAAYLVGEIEGLFMRDGVVTDRSIGWRGRGLIQLKTGKEQSAHPVTTERLNDTEYRMVIGDYPDAGENLHAEISMLPYRTDISLASDYRDFSGRFEFVYTVESMDVRISVWQNGAEICYEEQKYRANAAEKPDERAAGLLYDGILIDTVYRLPWGMQFLYGVEAKETGEIQLSGFQGTYLYPDAGYLETAARTYIRNNKTGVTIRKNSARLIRTRVGTKQVQTYFDDVGTGMSGRYRESFAGKYFIG